MVNPVIERSFDQIFQAAECAIVTKTPLPALMLLYSAIDIAAGLVSTDAEPSVRKGFVSWVNRHMAREKNLSCTAHDLYGARCGLLHGASPVSGLSRKGQARQVLYAWGKSEPAKLRQLTALAQMDRYVVVHINDLLKAVRLAVEGFLQYVAENPVISKRANKRASSIFGNMTEGEVDALHEWGKNRLAGQV